MKISELIEKLEEIQTEQGNLEVVVQYRDSGGEYNGFDEDIYVYIFNQNNEKYLIL